MALRKFIVTLYADTEDSFALIDEDIRTELECCCTYFNVIAVKEVELELQNEEDLKNGTS